jgi:hypothetical protein
MPRFLFVILCSVLLMTAASCSDSDDGVTDPGNGNSQDPVLHDNTIMVDDEPMTLVTVDGGSYVFRFTGSPTRMPEIGDIIVGEPDFAQGGVVLPAQVTGYVRRITDISQPLGGGPDVYEYTTVQAYLTEAVKEWKVDKTIPLVVGPPDVPVPGADDFILPGVTVENNRMTLSDVTLYDASIGPLQLTAVMDTGYVEIDPVYRYKLTIVDSEILSYSAVTTMKATFGCDLTLTAAAHLEVAPDPIEVWKKTDVKVAPVFFPVVHYITQTLSVGFTFEATGGVQMDVDDIEAKLTSANGFTYEAGSGYDPVTNTSYTLIYGDPVWSAWAQAEIRPYILYRVVDKFYGIAGPAIWVKPFLSIRGDTDFITEWCVHVSIGCECGVGASVGFLDDDMESWDSPSLFTPTIDLFDHCESVPWTALSASSPRAPELILIDIGQRPTGLRQIE